MCKKMFDQKAFLEPEPLYRVNPIVHEWPADRKGFMQAIKDYGFGGVVTNVPCENGFCKNPDNRREFRAITDELVEMGLDYWIYDEFGYPSGEAGGETLEGHPELEAKGFYMRRFAAYQEPKTIDFVLDAASDKIVWAAKYALDLEGFSQSYVRADRMQAIPFSARSLKCELKAGEALFVFCSKSAYEGSHCTHNVRSFQHYINLLDKKAVDRFKALCYERVAQDAPNAFCHAKGVFTDEPSLMVGYMRGYESWPYALAPYSDDLFEGFEQEYGYSLLPSLPFLFEGELQDAYRVRVDFYRLVGKRVAQSFSGNLAAWCEAHGTRFSGHYLEEEQIATHVKGYGDYLPVLLAASYPGIDMLGCYPEIYPPNTAKFAQMAARKKGTNGLMVEICPFSNVEEFAKDPINNMTGVMNLLYLGGARVTHSYFRADFTAYAPQFSGQKGYMTQDEANQFNRYVGRLGMMLDGLINDPGTWIYYGAEDAQAKMKPSTTLISGAVFDTDRSLSRLTDALGQKGCDYLFADDEDLENAAKGAGPSGVLLSGLKVDTILVPALDVLSATAAKALIRLADAGVSVLFIDKLPRYLAWAQDGDGDGEPVLAAHFAPVSLDQALAHWMAQERGDPFTVLAQDPQDSVWLTSGRYWKEDTELRFVVNRKREDARVVFGHRQYGEAALYDPENGSVRQIQMGTPVTVRALRGVFLVYGDVE